MKNARAGLAVLAAIVVLMSVMGLPLPPELSDPATLGNLPKTAASFSTAKRWLYEAVYGERRKTFYCGCEFKTRRLACKAAGSGLEETKNARCGRRPSTSFPPPSSGITVGAGENRRPSAVST
jgi:hypothetical protein